jgi:hypothetical protein
MQTANNIFSTVRSEGALLPPDLLRRIADGDVGVGGLSPADYHLEGEKVNEAVNRSWNRVSAAWRSFREASAKLPESDPGTSVTREKWLLPLFSELGYGRLQTAKAIAVGDRTYAISHGWQHTSIHLVGFRVDLDKRTAGVAGAARVTPHGLVQDLLNRSDAHLWGMLSNGLKLRLLRDSVSLVRQAYVEFDLESMMDGQVYSDFVLLWLLCHESRVEAENPADCWLERWIAVASEQGTRALDHLRDGVEAAIQALGQGFLQHRANRDLVGRLRSGDLSTQDYYRQLLRMVYRLIFLFVAEDRDFLFAPGTPDEAKTRYREHYSTARLRRLADHRRGSRHVDLWRGLRLVFGMLKDDRGCPEVGLPALNSFLWSLEATADLIASDITNASLLEAVRALAFSLDAGARRAVDFRNLGPEELGSVYESLLELHPVVNADAGTFALATAGGSERKTTGSYYTPDTLIQQLLDTALDPVIDRACRGADPESALLGLKVVDPACGSGHFLIAASHRLAKRVAAIRTGEDEPSPAAIRHALRDVIGRCIYGVDLNPMAVELCKVGLWMEALEPGRPLSFLDHRIQVGNSLLGATPVLMASGIPDEAFVALVGDDKGIVSAARKQNKKERDKETLSLFGADVSLWGDERDVAGQFASLATVDDTAVAGVHEKQRRFEIALQSDAYARARLIADAWCAAFLWPRSAGGTPPVLSEALHRAKRDVRAFSKEQRVEVGRLAEQYQFFHWHLAFPDVFSVVDEESAGVVAPVWRGGFDVVLGNPPWDLTELKEKEWFAERRPDITNARTGADRKRMIAALEKSDPQLFAAFNAELRKHEGVSHFLAESGRFPLCGRGRINLYAVFAEQMRTLLSPHGLAGAVLPTGIATDDTTKFFFQDVVATQSLVSLFDFENRGVFFPGVHNSLKFCLFTTGSGARPAADAAECVFFAHRVDDVREPDRRFTLSRADVDLLNPNTRTCPVFRSRKDAMLTRAIYRRVPILLREARGAEPSASPWGVRVRRLFNMGLKEVAGRATTVAHLSRSSNGAAVAKLRDGDGSFVPMWEGKMFDAYNHRAAGVEFNAANVQRGAQPVESTVANLTDPDYSPEALYWYPWPDVVAADSSRFAGRWMLAFKDVTSATNARSMIAAILPPAAANFSVRVVHFAPDANPASGAILLGVLNSFMFDYVLRQSLGGLHVSDYITHQVATITPEMLSRRSSWDSQCSAGEWITRRVLELSYTSRNLARFAEDCGWSGGAFRWDEERRFLLRCELDAAVFHLYLDADCQGSWPQATGETPEDLAVLRSCFDTPRDAVAYVLDTFPVVRRRDEDVFDGVYRTKRTILEVFDALQSAAEAGTPYKSLAVPPPADGACCHPPVADDFTTANG